MNILKQLSCVVLVAVLVFSCSKEEELGYKGTVILSVKAKGSSEVTEGDAATLGFKATISHAFSKDITLKLGADELAKYPLFTLPASLTIKRNQTSVEFDVTFAKKNFIYEYLLTKDKVFSFKVDSFKGISNRVQILRSDKITVKKKTSIPDLTEAQRDLLKTWKKDGVDVTGFVGRVAVKVKVTVSADDAKYLGITNVKEYKGYSNIAISAKAKNDKVLLDIKDNAFGLKEFMRLVFRKSTVEDTDFWYKPNWKASDYMPPNQIYVVETLLGKAKYDEWKKKTNKFDVSLDSIEIKKDKSIAFWYKNGAFETSPHHASDPKKDQVLGQASGGDTMNHIQFKYDFPFYDFVYDKVKKDAANYAKFYSGGSIHPDHYIVSDVIDVDNWGESLFVMPAASFDAANKKMTYTFCFDSAANQADYYKVEATYMSN